MSWTRVLAGVVAAGLRGYLFGEARVHVLALDQDLDRSAAR
jgi:hypothetical protein